MVAISSSRRRIARHALLQAAEELILFQRIQPDQDHDAVTEQHGDAIVVDPKRQRRRCQDIAAFEARRIQAIGDKEGAGRGAGPPSGDLEAWLMDFSNSHRCHMRFAY